MKGSTPTALSSGNFTSIYQEDELECLEGVCMDDLNQIRFDQRDKGAPDTAKQEADDEADAWCGHWGQAPKWRSCSCQMAWETNSPD